jgi:hypothetical protein
MHRARSREAEAEVSRVGPDSGAARPASATVEGAGVATASPTLWRRRPSPPVLPRRTGRDAEEQGHNNGSHEEARDDGRTGVRDTFVVARATSLRLVCTPRDVELLRRVAARIRRARGRLPPAPVAAAQPSLPAPPTWPRRSPLLLWVNAAASGTNARTDAWMRRWRDERRRGSPSSPRWSSVPLRRRPRARAEGGRRTTRSGSSLRAPPWVRPCPSSSAWSSSSLGQPSLIPGQARREVVGAAPAGRVLGPGAGWQSLLDPPCI